MDCSPPVSSVQGILQARILELVAILSSRGSFPSHCIILACLCAKSLQLCPIFCNPMDYSPPGSTVHADSPGKNTGVGCHSLLQGIFPTQGSKSGLLYCRQTDNHLLHILDLNLDGYGSRARPLLPLTK